MAKPKASVAEDAGARRAKFLWLWIGLASFVAIGLADYIAGAGVSVSTLYVVPLFILTWYVAPWVGLAAMGVATADLFSFLWLPRDAGGNGDRAWNSALELVLFALVVWLAARLRRTLERERENARTDHLTGTLNARAFEEVVHMELRRAERSGKPITVAFADVDDFKAVNDTFGHQVGDEVLRVLAGTMRQSVRASDALARLGGDEFALLLPECGSQAGPLVLTRLHDRLLEAMRRNGWPATVSVGAATFEEPPSSYSAILRKVDGLMYEAKRAGKGAFRHDVAASRGELGKRL